jgi:hypothetical protein
MTDGNALREGARVCFRREFDPAKNKAVSLAGVDITPPFICHLTPITSHHSLNEQPPEVYFGHFVVGV